MQQTFDFRAARKDFRPRPNGAAGQENQVEVQDSGCKALSGEPAVQVTSCISHGARPSGGLPEVRPKVGPGPLWNFGKSFPVRYGPAEFPWPEVKWRRDSARSILDTRCLAGVNYKFGPLSRYFAGER